MSNQKKFIWFDSNYLKDKASLTEEQKNYIKQPSISVFGPMNIIIRNHWDLFLWTFFIALYSRISLHSIYLDVAHNRRLS